METGNGAVVEGSIVKIEQSPAKELAQVDYHHRAAQAAGFVKAIVLENAVKIQGKRYVPVTSYQAIANAMGCVASAKDVRRVDGGWVALGQVKRISDGMVLAEGEGFVGSSETKWGSGPEYAARSMAQTRAIGRACRAAFAFVVPMIDLGLSETPAEEMEGIAQGAVEPPAPRGREGLKSSMRPSPPPAQASPPRAVASEPPSGGTTPTHDRSMSFAFGRDKGKPIGEVEESSLKWFESKLLADLDDESKSRWHEKTRQQLTTLRAELAWRGL